MMIINIPAHKLLRFIVIVFTVGAVNLPVVGSALELKNDESAPIVDQITAKVLGEIESALRAKASDIPAIARRIASPVDEDKTANRLTSSAELVRLLEGENTKTVQLKLAVEPTLLKATNDIEITVLAFFSVSGSKLHSGMLTLQIIQPVSDQDVIKCAVRLGHVTFSTSALVE
jgi:hypothetical protein